MAPRLFDREWAAEHRVNESRAEPWANSIIAYAMAFSSVLSAMTALANGRTTASKLENVAMLAHWSKSYAVQAYHSSKLIGLLNTAKPNGQVGMGEEEDLALADAGLDNYAEMLRQDDRP